MQAAPARYVSVSELYSTDEVELLLDEIRELEPTSCRGEDVQDFEIAGSGCSGGGLSPSGTEGTERSWDSHAQYRRAPPPRALPLAPLYCRPRLLASPRAAAALSVVACSGAVLGCVWAGAGVGARAGQLPLGARVQLLQLAALSSLLLHALLLALHLTNLTALMPLDWNRLGMWTSVWSGVSLGVGAALTLHALFTPEYRWAPAHLATLLYTASGLGMSGACASGALAVASGWRAPPAYRAVPTAHAHLDL